MSARSSRTGTKAQNDVALRAARQAVREFTNSKAFKESVSETLKTTLEGLGIDTAHPDLTRRDFVQLRDWRELMEFIKKKGIGTVVTYLIGGLLAAVAAGLVVILNR